MLVIQISILDLTISLKAEQGTGQLIMLLSQETLPIMTLLGRLIRFLTTLLSKTQFLVLKHMLFT